MHRTRIQRPTLFTNLQGSPMESLKGAIGPATNLLGTILFFFIILTDLTVAQTQFVKYRGSPVLRVGPNPGWEYPGVETGGFQSEGGKYRIWYHGWNQSQSGIGYATSPDGIHWEKSSANPLFSAANVWPSTCIIDSGQFDLYAVLQNSSGVYDVIRAISPDVITWALDSLHNPLSLRGTAGSWDDLAVNPRVILKRDSLWAMWYTGFNNASFSRIGYATSTDAIHWTKPSPFQVLGEGAGWDQFGVSVCDVLFEQGVYRMWYSSGGVFGYATSVDGQIWTKYPSNPIYSAESIDVTEVWLGLCRVSNQGGVYKMWYDQIPNTLAGGTLYQIGFAVDSDSGYIMAHPAVATFDTTHTDSTGNTIPIYLRNYGRHSAQILSLTLTSQDFELLNPPALPYTMTTGQRDTMKVRFTPQHGGMGYDTLRIVSTSAADTVFEVYLSGLATGVVDARSGVPRIFALEQNYPNPFNPTTNIRYHIAPARRGESGESGGDSRLVKLVVCDILGREVAVLVNQHHAPGNYSVQFDGSSLCSGVYFYRLQSGPFIQTRRMLLIR